MEVLKIHNLKTAKQLIELENQGKIKLDIYESLKNAFLKNSKKIFDLLIITYYKSIDFNKRIYSHTILGCMIIYRSKYLNFILTNVKMNIDINYIKNIFHSCSYKSFKKLTSFDVNLSLDMYNIFNNLCMHNSLKSIKLFISIIKPSMIKDLILKKDPYGYSSLDYACNNKLSIVKYLIYFIKSIDLKSIDIDSRILLNDKYKENIIKYLLENFNFNLNELYKYGTLFIHYFNLNIIKLLLKNDGNINLEFKDNFDKTSIYYISNINSFKFLAKYEIPEIISNKQYDNSEIFKFIFKNF